MKNIQLAIIILSLALCNQAIAQDMRVATFNLRYANPKDTGNLWADRLPIVTGLIDFHDFDIFGTQEGLLVQLQGIEKNLPAYARYGVGRDDGQEKGEFSAIFYKKDKYRLLDKGDFWLSVTPDKPSLGWDAVCCFRICSWVRLEETRTKKTFYFFNVHFDHQGVKAREESSKLILQKIKEIAGNNPVILTGDFNGSHSSSWYQAIANSGVLKDVYSEVKQPYAFNGSFNSFGKSLGTKDIIDHIFISSQFTAKKYGILSDSYYGGKFPSDHYPVLSIINFH